MADIDIEVCGLTHRYGPTQQVPTLEIPHLKLKAGEFVSLIGPSGCGKSTLLMLIGGLLEPTEGEIRFGGQPISGTPYEDMGVMFQNDLLLEWRSVLANVLLQGEIRDLPRKSIEKEAHHLLSIAGLDGLERASPSELSGGMRQRVAICRALVHDPSVLLMDEPFAALDALTREKMGQFLGSLGEVAARTVVFVTHSIPEAVMLSDRVLVMGTQPGEIVDDVRINLPRPRDRTAETHPEYQKSVAHLRSYFEGDV